MSAPTKSERQACWDARDQYWECLESNEEKQENCKVNREAFEKNCSNTWVKYFDRRRDYLKYKKKIEEDGYEPVKQ